MPIENLPKGAVRDTPDIRDYKLEDFMGGASAPPDFIKGHIVSPRAPISDQGSSDACGPHATTKMHWHIRNQLNFSLRDLAARVLGSYGSNARDNIMAIVNAGQALESDVPTPAPETPANMRDKTGIAASKEANYRALNGFYVGGDIDSVASAIVAYGALLLGLDGTNAGWHNIVVPEPPTPAEQNTVGDVWGHFLCAEGFHMHQNADGTEEKCIITSTSWSSDGITEHHIRQRYFNAQAVFNPWTLIASGNKPMYKKVVKQDGKTFGVLIETPNGDQIIYATSEDQWKSWNQADSYQLNTVNADGTTNWAVDITLPW